MQLWNAHNVQSLTDTYLYMAKITLVPERQDTDANILSRQALYSNMLLLIFLLAMNNMSQGQLMESQGVPDTLIY